MVLLTCNTIRLYKPLYKNVIYGKKYQVLKNERYYTYNALYSVLNTVN